MSTSQLSKRLRSQSLCPVRARRSQSGIVLIVALIMLVIISLMAAMSVRNATSSEGVNANVRQTQLASQSAETALRYCEDALLNVVSGGTATFNISSPPSSTTVALSAIHIQDYAATPNSTDTTKWDNNTDYKVLVLPAALVNHPGLTSTFKRPPECMIERLTPPPSTSPSYSKSFNITARGFGPEVASADASRSRPTGSEVWMQSSIELN